MKRERRQPTRSELASITSSRPVVRRIPAPDRPDGTSPACPKVGALARALPSGGSGAA